MTGPAPHSRYFRSVNYVNTPDDVVIIQGEVGYAFQGVFTMDSDVEFIQDERTGMVYWSHTAFKGLGVVLGSRVRVIKRSGEILTELVPNEHAPVEQRHLTFEAPPGVVAMQGEVFLLVGSMLAENVPAAYIVHEGVAYYHPDLRYYIAHRIQLLSIPGEPFHVHDLGPVRK